MASLRNRVQLVGNLGMNPEIKSFDNGRKMAKFSLATNETFGVNGQERTETEWHTIIAWGKQAEIAEQHLKKGNEVAIEGRLTHRKYEDKNQQTRYFTEIVLGSYVVYPGLKK
ncbi:single-stranded DNA-binding protein [Carboxylicivirga sp. N1Y90]|uniref:single-stranded DNA-binding protein n=1 Tax=Carboxylicivirga fragile TaxID=3417571 RepID=UPI003D358874|nr:single-stranded DNA-binding protein [Marinilabiliaceae bacterium N1Y90]